MVPVRISDAYCKGFAVRFRTVAKHRGRWKSEALQGSSSGSRKFSGRSRQLHWSVCTSRGYWGRSYVCGRWSILILELRLHGHQRGIYVCLYTGEGRCVYKDAFYNGNIVRWRPNGSSRALAYGILLAAKLLYGELYKTLDRIVLRRSLYSEFLLVSATNDKINVVVYPDDLLVIGPSRTVEKLNKTIARSYTVPYLGTTT